MTNPAKNSRSPSPASAQAPAGPWDHIETRRSSDNDSGFGYVDAPVGPDLMRGITGLLGLAVMLAMVVIAIAVGVRIGFELAQAGLLNLPPQIAAFGQWLLAVSLAKTALFILGAAAVFVNGGVLLMLAVVWWRARKKGGDE